MKEEPLSKDDLILLYEIDHVIQRTGNGRDDRMAKPRKGRRAEEEMLTIFECTKGQIAHDPSEITANTKVYVGQLEPGIFQKFPESLERVYTAFPEREICRESVEIGVKSKEQLISEMQTAGVIVSNYVKSMMDNPDFIIGTNREEVELVRLTVLDLGFKTGATANQIYERAQVLGLEPCPPDTGPNYRLEHTDQILNDWVNIGMVPIADQEDNQVIFYVGHDSDGLWLEYSVAGPEQEWDPADEFVFRFRKVEA